jgi:hypothetical protein
MIPIEHGDCGGTCFEVRFGGSSCFLWRGSRIAMTGSGNGHDDDDDGELSSISVGNKEREILSI